MSAPSITTVLCLSAALLGAASVHADERDGPAAVPRGGRGGESDGERHQHQQRQEALADSVRRIERSRRGQVLSAERVPYDGRDINRIKVVDDRGRVRVYMDDPARPRPVRTRGDDD